MKKKRINIFLVSAIVILGVCLFGALFFVLKNEKNEFIPDAGKVLSANQPIKTVIFDNVEVPLRNGISSLLVIGTENSEENEKITNLMLLVFDDTMDVVTPFLINCNSTCVGSDISECRIADLYFGADEKSSCEAVSSAVSDILFGIRPDGYISFPADFNITQEELMQGVSNATAYDETGTVETMVLSEGIDAYSFLTDNFSAVQSDEEKQILYFSAFAEAVKNTADADERALTELFREFSDYVYSNLSLNSILDYMDKFQKYECKEVVSSPGEYSAGDSRRFNLDQDALFDYIRDLFC